MKTIHSTSSPLRTLVGCALFAGFALTAPSLYAQTFAGRDYITELPVSLRANVHPVANRSAICMHVENSLRGGIHIQIFDQTTRAVYDKWEYGPKYTRQFNLSALSSGSYTVRFTTREGQYTQTFRIEPPTGGRIVLSTQMPDSLLANY